MNTLPISQQNHTIFTEAPLSFLVESHPLGNVPAGLYLFPKGCEMSKRIPLTRGKFAIVDDADHEWLSQYQWCALRNKHHWYAITSQPGNNKKKIYMHRLILNAPKGLLVDHKNRDGLDNRRANIRLCTNSENMQNQGPRQRPNKTYKGISPKGNRWAATISLDGNRTYLGSFPTEADAARAYDRAASNAFGDFARLNFDDND